MRSPLGRGAGLVKRLWTVSAGAGARGRGVRGWQPLSAGASRPVAEGIAGKSHATPGGGRVRRDFSAFRCGAGGWGTNFGKVVFWQAGGARDARCAVSESESESESGAGPRHRLARLALGWRLPPRTPADAPHSRLASATPGTN
ncbi:hypothetical protein GCM10010277_23250 [Streptomyces longisporoflavus]|nr:hypothetical protein GCM10010277_23250 [Streptomyces longisporoflavus]